MLSIVDAAFRKEASEYRFRFGCEACAHFDPEARRCGNGYPIEPHLETDLERVKEVLFCKEFELR
jgi:hypothetical protein